MDNDKISKEIANVDDEGKKASKLLQHRSDDYEYGREVLYQASERLQDVLEAAVELARESEHPRAIEVAANTARDLADVAGKLMKHQMDVNKVNGENPSGNSEKSVTNNNLNVKMNTKDLLDLLNKE